MVDNLYRATQKQLLGIHIYRTTQHTYVIRNRETLLRIELNTQQMAMHRCYICHHKTSNEYHHSNSNTSNQAQHIHFNDMPHRVPTTMSPEPVMIYNTITNESTYSRKATQPNQAHTHINVSNRSANCLREHGQLYCHSALAQLGLLTSAYYTRQPKRGRCCTI